MAHNNNQGLGKGEVPKKGRTSMFVVLIIAALAFFGGIGFLSSKTKQSPTNQPKTNTQKVINPIFSTKILDQTKPVDENVKYLYSIHPDDNCRADMTKWLSQGDVYIEIVDSLGKDREMQVMNFYDTVNKVEIPGLSVLSNFFTYTNVASNDDIMMEKYMVLYHEYTHLKNHFNGTWPLEGRANEVNKKPIEVQAKYYWGAEHEAYKAQWEFLKKHDLSRLMISQKVVAEKGERKAWLDFLLNSLQKTHESRTNISSKQYKRMSEVWQSLYDEELKK